MYKTRLQELCHEKLWDLPEYSSRKEGQDHNPRFYATVSVNGRSFETPSPSPSSKKAQNDAAKVAFDYFSFASSYSAPTPENIYKNLLQSYAQKKSLALPCYSSEHIGPPHAMHFKCKVTVGGQTYESQELFTTLSKAEHAAAEVALLSLAPEGIQEDESAYKNLLQELAQKESFQLPSYSTTGSGEAHKLSFISVAEVGGEKFSGLQARTKKHAEFSAAKVAYTALKQRSSKQSPLTSGSSSAHSIDSFSANLRQNVSFDNLNQISPSTSPPRQRQRLSKSSSSSQPDFAASLHENAQPELSGPDKEPLEDKEAVEAGSKSQQRAAEVTVDVTPDASPVQASCPSSGAGMLSSPIAGVLPVIASGEHEKVANVSSQKKIPV